MVSDVAIYSGQIVVVLSGQRERPSILEPRTCNVFLGVSDEKASGAVSYKYQQDVEKKRSNLLVPQHGWQNRTQMPQAVRIHHTHPRREIQQLETHSQDNPGHAQTGPDRPRPPNPLILHVTEAAPEQVRHDANSDIGSHIVRVVPRPERQVHDMHHIQRNAKPRPKPQQALFPRLLPIQPKHPDRRIIQPIQHIRARSKVIQLLRDPKVPRMEYHAKRPARQAHVSKPQIVFP